MEVSFFGIDACWLLLALGKVGQHIGGTGVSIEAAYIAMVARAVSLREFLRVTFDLTFTID
jgi:hypothetical protein